MIKVEINGYEFPFESEREALTFIDNNGIKNKIKITNENTDEILSYSELNDIVYRNSAIKKKRQ